MKALKRSTTRRRSGNATEDSDNLSDHSGFNAKTLKNASNYDEVGDRKMRLNNKPLVNPVAGTKPKLTSSVMKVSGLGLRATLNRGNRPESDTLNDSSRNLMDDQSVASFGITDSLRFKSHPSMAEALAASTTTDLSLSTRKSLRRNSSQGISLGTSLSSVQGDKTRDAKTMQTTKDKLHNSVSDISAGTTTEPIDMFDDFTQERRSSVNHLGHSDPFGNTDAFASNTIDHSYLQPPAVQRASKIDEEQSDDGVNHNSANLSEGDSNKPKKSKMQKITELLTEKKAWALERRALRQEMLAQAQQIASLETRLKEAGDVGTRAEVLRSMAEQDEQMRKVKRDLDRSQKEMKLAKKLLLEKKGEMLSRDKVLEANVTEIATLRKELSQALQQVDMLEEEQENDKAKILKLTKDLAYAGQSDDDNSFIDGETRQEQQEMFERELKKKDRQIESQRIEVNNQVEQILQLKTELDRARDLMRKKEDLVGKMAEANEEINAELESRIKELADLRQTKDFQTSADAAKLDESERRQKQLLKELEETQRELDTARRSLTSLSIGRGDESLDKLQKELTETKTALSESERKIEQILAQSEESESQFKETISRLEEQNMKLQSKLDEVDPNYRIVMEELRQANQSLEDTMLDLKRKIDDDRRESDKLESKLNAQISSLRSSLEASQNLHQQSEDEAKRGVSGLQAKLSETELALEEMRLYNEELEASAEELRETSADFEQELSRLQEEYDALQSKVRKIEDELNSANDIANTVGEVQARLVEVQEQAFILSEKNQQLEHQLSQVADENEYLKENVEEVEGDAAEARQAVSALEELMDEYDDLQDEAQALREKALTLEAELGKSKVDCQKWKLSAERTDQELKEAREMLVIAEESQKELQILRSDADQLRLKSIETEKKLKEGDFHKAELQSRLDRTQVELDEALAIVAELEEEQLRLLAFEEEVETLREMNQSTELKLQEIIRERDEWMHMANAATLDAETKQAAVAALKSSRNEYAAFEVEAAELRAIVNAHEAKIKELSSERDKLIVIAGDADFELEKAKATLVSMHKLKEDHDALTTEAGRLRHEKTQLDAELKTLLKEKGEVETSVRAVEAAAFSENEAMKRELERYERDFNDLARKNGDLVVKVAELNSSVDNWRKKVSEAEVRAESADKKLTEYKEHIQALERTTTELRESKQHVLVELEDLRVNCEKWKSGNEKAAFELDETKKTIQSLEKQVLDLRQPLDEISRNESEIGDVRERAMTAELEVEDLRLVNQQLRSEIDSLTAARDEWKLKAEALRYESNSVLDSENTKQELHSIRHENERLAAYVEELTQERNHLVEKNMEVQLQLADRDSSLASLDEAKRARTAVQAELDDLRELNSAMESQIENITNERNHWQQMAEASEHQAGEANDALISLEEQMDQMRRVERDQMNWEMKAFQSQIDDLLNERDNLRASLAKADESIATAETEISSLQSSLSEIDTLRIKVDTLTHENVDLEDRLALLVKELDELNLVKSKCVEADSKIESLQAEREELLVSQNEASTLRDQNTKFMGKIADLEADCWKLRTAAEHSDKERDAATKRMLDSEQQLANLESQYGEMESQIENLNAERESLQSSLALAQMELAKANVALSSSMAAESELVQLKAAHAELTKDSDALQSKRAAIEEELAELLIERDQLKESVALAERKAEELSNKLALAGASEKVLIDLKTELIQIRDMLNISADDDVLTTIEHLQQDYSDLLDENDRMRESIADVEGEIEELHAEREVLISQAEKGPPGSASEASTDATGMQELCEELQRQLQAMARDRDTWKETAESATRVGNSTDRRRRPPVDNDDCSVSSGRTAATEQKILLQQALEYRERRDGKRSSWGFSPFGAQRSTKVETDPTDEASARELLIDRLTEDNEMYQETITKLRSELVGLNISLKEESYSTKKKLDALDQENQAYELKVMVLEQELERLGAEFRVNGEPIDSKRVQALERELQLCQSEKNDAEQKIASLRTEFDKLHRASAIDSHHKQVEIDHLKTIQGDIQAKVDALENMMNAINQENETLRQIAQKAGNFSLDSDLGKQIEEDDKDVKIAQLYHELADLRLQGHQKLKDQVLQLQGEKRDMQNAMEKHYQIVDEENRSHLEDLEMRLRAREQTIKQLEHVLETLTAKTEDGSGGEFSFDADGDDSTYVSEKVRR